MFVISPKRKGFTPVQRRRTAFDAPPSCESACLRALASEKGERQESDRYTVDSEQGIQSPSVERDVERVELNVESYAP